MGRGTIKSESGDGLYSITVDTGSDRIESFISALQSRLDSLNAQIPTYESEYLQEKIKSDALWQKVSDLIPNYRTDPSKENLAAIDKATTEAVQGQSRTVALDRELSAFKLEKSNVEARIARYQAETVSLSRSAWCADYTLEATGDVGLIEVNGEGPEIIIAPGAEAPKDSDGQLIDRLAMSSAATFYNAATLPGWQKYLPTYRLATLNSIDRENNRGNVSLFPALSTAQSLDTNQTSTLFGVEFDYMSCNHRAFSVGDEVVVKFEDQDWLQPKIIGFRDNPRQCGPARIIVPLELISISSAVAQSTALFTDIIETDTQHTPCVGGQIYIRRPAGPIPPGYKVAGQVRNAFQSAIELRTVVSGGGIIASDDEWGSISTFEFTSDWTIAGGAKSLTYTDGDAISSQLEVDSGEDWRIWDVTTFTPGATGQLDDYRAEIRNISFVTADLEENSDTIQCIKTEASRYWDNLPQTIEIQAVGGSGGIVYELDRWFKVLDYPAHPAFPSSTLGGAALGYRRRQN